MIFRAEEAATAAAESFPTWGYGAIAFVVFIALGLITYSYRDVANRSLKKGSDSQGHH
jgi:uncharacterized membrane-anchored protein YhcB (DUF1043 family)